MRLSPETLTLYDFWWVFAIGAAVFVVFLIYNALRRGAGPSSPPPRNDQD